MTDRRMKEWLIERSNNGYSRKCNNHRMTERENMQYELIKIHNEISYLEKGLINHSLSDADIKYTIDEIKHLREREEELERKLGLSEK